MTATTSELALSTAQDLDDTADYLTIALANSLHTLDALFNNTTGHNHGSAHQGGAISTIPASAIPDGAITSAKIADGSITSLDIADGTITGTDIAANTITSANILDGTIANADLAAGVAYANLANRSIVDVQTQFFSAAMATASGSLVATLDGISYTPINPNGILMAFYQGTFSSTLDKSLLSMAIGWKGGVQQAQGVYMPLNIGAFVQLHVVFASPGAGGTMQFFFATNGGTVQAVPGIYRQLTLLEFKK